MTTCAISLLTKYHLGEGKRLFLCPIKTHRRARLCCSEHQLERLSQAQAIKAQPQLRLSSADCFVKPLIAASYN